MTGQTVEKLGDLEPVLTRAKNLLHPVPPDRRWTPYLGETLDAGMATLFAEEGIEAVRFIYGSEPQRLAGFHLAGGTSFTNPEFQKNGDGHLNGPIDDIPIAIMGYSIGGWAYARFCRHRRVRQIE